jgi:SAM-dependent methyltransferase
MWATTALRKWLAEPETRDLDINGVELSTAHRRVLQKKKMLRALFAGFYRRCRAADERFFGLTPGGRLEIGSGAGIIKQYDPQVITSDIKPLPFVDLVAPAERLPLPDASLRAVYGINVFHHIPDPSAFFRELLRVVHPGGGAVLIEPYYGPVARRLFVRLHAEEGFDVTMPGWRNTQQQGPCSRVNQALSYIVFRRDYAEFCRRFPTLELVFDQPHTQLMYFLSGGVNFRQLLPDAATPLVQAAEALLAPLNRWIALQHLLVLRRRS